MSRDEVRHDLLAMVRESHGWSADTTDEYLIAHDTHAADLARTWTIEDAAEVLMHDIDDPTDDHYKCRFCGVHVVGYPHTSESHTEWCAWWILRAALDAGKDTTDD